MANAALGIHQQVINTLQNLYLIDEIHYNIHVMGELLEAIFIIGILKTTIENNDLRYTLKRTPTTKNQISLA